MFARVKTVGLFGMNAFEVDVEVERSRGMDKLEIVGLADVSVRESRERISSAFRSCEIPFPRGRVIVNLAPADVKKSGSSQDLAIAVSIMLSSGIIGEECTQGSAFMGELSLGGELRPINGVLPMVLSARRAGIKRVFVPKDNAFEASVAEGLGVFGVGPLRELLEHLLAKRQLPVMPVFVPREEDSLYSLDVSQVRGQRFAKTALEIAACGGHNLIMIGAPGTGKSMLAERMPTILPKMTLEESIETTNIYSIAGMIDKNSPLVTKRPFRSPHHTVSSAGLVGGGSIPRPGEISLAHNGLLFLDELPEFDRSSLEILRQPIEDGRVTISRAMGTVTYPADIMIVAAMNPCPCGYYGHPKRSCSCTPRQVGGYLSKVSGPLLDRFDLHVEVAPVEYSSLSSDESEESSAEILKRVEKAREIQKRRYLGTGISCNARLTPELMRTHCRLTDSADKLLGDAFERLGLSARAHDKILKVARTIADMSGEELIDKSHIAQAIRYRNLDRKYWK